VDGTPAVSSQFYGVGMADAHTRIDSLKEDIRALSDSVLDLQAKAREHDAKFEQILGSLGHHETMLESQDRQLEQVLGLLGRDEAKLDTHDRRFDYIDAQLAEILARLPQRPTP
jgi:chromosome segregation ATPase